MLHPLHTQAGPLVSLALQGGGAHGAFTWGVLDALLAHRSAPPRFDLIVGASAGALNGAALLYGLHQHGVSGAREMLRKVWTAVSDASLFSPLRANWVDRVFGGGRISDWHPGFLGLDALLRTFTPQQFNPLGLNPMRDLLENLFDSTILAEALARPDLPQLIISATDVLAGRAVLFSGAEITLETLVASASLPFMSPPVRIAGRDYWDGSYSGNPPLAPIIEQGQAAHILIVDITPTQRSETPNTPTTLFDRLSEIGMNAALDAEIAGVERINALIDKGLLAPGPDMPRRVHIHRLQAGELVAGHPGDKLNTDSAFLDTLHAAGETATRKWLRGLAETA